MDANGPPRRQGMPDADQVAERLRALLGRESVADDYVRLRIDVLRAQAAVLARLDDSTAPPLAPGPTGDGPAIVPDRVPFDASLARQLFDAVARSCRRYGRPAPDLLRLQSAVGREPSLLEQLVRHAALVPDQGQLTSLGGRLEVSGELLVFFGRLLAAPLVTFATRLASQPGSISPPTSGTCPICGSTAGLASLRPDDGARVLHCSLCANPWRFTRLDCPFCSPNDQCSLMRLAVAGEDARWIEACDRCRRYLKLADRRNEAQGQHFLPLVEEVTGLYLDLLAEREGYQRGPVYAALA